MLLDRADILARGWILDRHQRHHREVGLGPRASGFGNATGLDQGRFVEGFRLARALEGRDVPTDEFLASREDHWVFGVVVCRPAIDAQPEVHLAQIVFARLNLPVQFGKAVRPRLLCLLLVLDRLCPIPFEACILANENVVLLLDRVELFDGGAIVALDLVDIALNLVEARVSTAQIDLAAVELALDVVFLLL